MSIINIYLQLIPLTLLILCGYFAGRKQILTKEQVFPLLYYVFAPIIVISSVLKTNIRQNPELVYLFGIFLFITFVIYFIVYFLFYRTSSSKSLIAFMSSSTNSGYFGLPLIIFVLGKPFEIYGVACLLAYLVAEGVLGFSNYNWKSYVKVPTLIAFVVGGILSSIFDLSRIVSNQTYISVIDYNRYSFIIFGMILLGTSISHISIDKKLISESLKITLFRAALWAIFGIGISYTLFIVDLISRELFLTIAVLSVTPISANSVIVGLKKNLVLDITPASILVSTIFSIITLPLFLAFIL